MRAAKLAFLFLVLSATSFAQQSASRPTTITGCLMSLNGAFTLLTPNGEHYILKGDHDTLFSYNGKQVQITGTPKSSKKATANHEFQVSSIKKLADVCQ
jgi:hypothetical protein